MPPGRQAGSAGARPKRRYVDTRTRFGGVYARHSLLCDLGIGRATCNCRPSYWGKVWDADLGRNRKTPRRRVLGEARNLRDDLRLRVQRGELPVERVERVVFNDGCFSFLDDCRAGVALNKQGRPYTKKAILNLESSLRRLPASLRRKRLCDLRRSDFQAAVDGFRREGLSSSRIRAIVNAARSLFRWAIDRDKATENAAAGIRLPAPDSKERDRVATPGEFSFLLDLLKPEDALPWAIAAYSSARLQEIQALEWPEVDLERGLILLAGDEEARKTEAARRLVPMVEPLRRRLEAEWNRQSRPASGRVCPARKASQSGLLCLNGLSKKIASRWSDAGCRPIGLQDSRHTTATWLDHAGVAPKVASVFMGHKAPGRHLHPGAAPITLRRYTHVLAGELERARDQLDEFLAGREAEERGHSFRLEDQQ